MAGRVSVALGGLGEGVPEAGESHASLLAGPARPFCKLPFEGDMPLLGLLQNRHPEALLFKRNLKRDSESAHAANYLLSRSGFIRLHPISSTLEKTGGGKV